MTHVNGHKAACRHRVLGVQGQRVPSGIKALSDGKFREPRRVRGAALSTYVSGSACERACRSSTRGPARRPRHGAVTFHTRRPQGGFPSAPRTLDGDMKTSVKYPQASAKQPVIHLLPRDPVIPPLGVFPGERRVYVHVNTAHKHAWSLLMTAAMKGRCPLRRTEALGVSIFATC